MKNTVETMSAKEALKRTLFEFKISNAQLSRDSQLTESQISEFKNAKKDLNTDSWFKLVAALPSQARSFYLDLVFDVRGCVSILRETDVTYTKRRAS